MNSEEFANHRKKLGKTQKEIAKILGVALKTIHSYEQGWRTVPVHVERQIFFLVSRQKENRRGKKPCWTIRKCSTQQRRQCPAWEFSSGDLCWFINGTNCDGTVQKDWKEKMKICRNCQVFSAIL